MEKIKAAEVLFISLNQNIPLIGKLWLTVFLLLRVFVLLFAGFPLFLDEGDHFVCNTIHPGCARVCFDAFSPLSLCRYGFLHLVCVCLPSVLYVTHHTHCVLTALTRQYFAQEHTLPLKLQMPTLWGSKLSTGGGLGGRITGLYLLQLLLRLFLELAFGVGQYFLFGVSVRRDFLCLQEPCSPAVECFTSRATEKSLLLQWMLGNVALSVILSVAEMLIVLKGAFQDRKKQTEEENKEERKRYERQKSDFVSNETVPLTPRFVRLPFWKRKPSDPTNQVTPSLTPKSSLLRWSEVGYEHTPSRSPSQASEQVGCKVVLCSAERMRLWKGHCGKNGSVKDPFTVSFMSHRTKSEPWNPASTHKWRAGEYTPATTTAEPTSDSSEGQDRKAWV